jgi:hypothetical protein
MSALGRGLSALGYNAAEQYGKLGLMDAQSEIDIQKAMRLEEAKARIAKAPLNRLQGMARSKAGEEVPLEAGPVSSLTGAGVDGPSFEGDPRELLKQISALPDSHPDKAPMMAQLRTQYGSDMDANRKAVSGKTRKRTSDEALEAALDDAKVNDLEAYSAGKGLMNEKTVTVPDGATVLDRSGKVIFANTGKNDRALELENRRDDRARLDREWRDSRAAADNEARDARQREALDSAERRAQTREDAREHRSMNKALPGAAAKALLENQANLRTAQKALTLASGGTVGDAKGDPNATGAKGYLPNQLLNRLDAEGVDTRAAIADLGSMVIHDRSGAAVTASEFPRLAPFIPTEKDDAATVKKKLNMFVTNYRAIIDDQVTFYRESGYKVPVEGLRSGDGGPNSQTPAAKAPPNTPPVSIDAMEAEMRRRGLLK